jgi:hypothetical protein
MAMARNSTGKWLGRLAVAVTRLAAPVQAAAQSCPLCYNAVAAAKASVIRALNSGVLVLLIPVLLTIGGIFLVAFRKRDLFREVAREAGVESGFRPRLEQDSLASDAAGEEENLAHTDLP